MTTTMRDIRATGERLATDEVVHSVQVKAPNFGNVCCSFCCLFTGFTGVLLLGIFALCLRFQWYFDAEFVIGKTEEERNGIYNAQAIAFAIGAALELLVGVVSIFWVRSVLKKMKAYKESKDE